MVSLTVNFCAASTENRVAGRCLFSFIPCVFEMIKYAFNVAFTLMLIIDCLTLVVNSKLNDKEFQNKFKIESTGNAHQHITLKLYEWHLYLQLCTFIITDNATFILM